MVFVRRVVSRSSSSLFRARPAAPRKSPMRPAWNRIARRGYASEGHGEHKSSGDLPWALGAVGVGGPCAAYLWVNGTKREEPHEHGAHDDHGEHGEHGEHEESSEESHEGGAGDDQQGSEGQGDVDANEESGDQKGDSTPEAQGEKSDESSSDEDGGGDTPDTSDDESGSKSGEDQSKSEESDAQDGEGGDSQDKPRWGKKNKGPLDAGQQVPTHAKHKGSPHEDLTKSKKGEGIHDTAKVLQTIDPNRPAKPRRPDE